MIRRLLTLACLLAPLSSGGPADAAAFPWSNDSGLPTVAPLVRQVTPGVVNISVKGHVQVSNPLLQDPFFRRFFNVPNGGLRRETQAAGSGVIVDAAAGTVLTNNHVVANADLIQVTLADKRSFKAKLVGTDPATDIAVLRIPADNLTAVAFGDSTKVEVGDFVLAIGNPFALGQTVTSGIVSALGRSGLGIEGVEDFIQTDASINPGNSGGALVDLRGRLIGINTAILAPSGGNVGVGFAVPVSIARTVMEQLLKTGKIERGWIGIGGQDLTPDLAQGLGTRRTEGAVIAEIEPNTPAAQAGLRPGDLVTAVDGAPITAWRQLTNQLALARVGQTLTLTVERQGAPVTATVVVAKRPRQANVLGQPGPFGQQQPGDQDEP